MSIIGNALNVAKTAVSTASTAAAKAVEVVAPVVPPTAPELAVDVLKDSGLGDAFSDIADGPDEVSMTAETTLLERPTDSEDSLAELGEALRDARQEAKLENNLGQAKVDAAVAKVGQAKSQMALDKAQGDLVKHQVKDLLDGPDTKRENKMQEMELDKLEAKVEKAQQKNWDATVDVIKSNAALNTAESDLKEFHLKEAQEDGKLIGIAPALNIPTGELKGAGNAIGQAVGDVAGGAAEAAGGFLGNVIETHQNIVGGAAEAAGGIIGNVFDAQKSIAGGAASAAGSFIGNVFEAQQSVVGGAADAAGEVAEGVTDAVSDVAGGIGDGVKKLFGG